MNDALRAWLRAEFPDHFICRARKDGRQYFIGIPKKHAGKPVPSMPGLTVDMLHGATIVLGSSAS